MNAVVKPRSHKPLIISLSLLIGFMGIFSFLLIPIYNLICKHTGINGKSVTAAEQVQSLVLNKNRVIKVEFSTSLNQNLHFRFIPLVRNVYIHPGERKRIYFLAENHTGHDIIVQAVPSITPVDGALYLKKTECFCFSQQFFKKNEKAKMPVNFYIDSEIGDNIREMTLSYTLFDASEYALGRRTVSPGRIVL